MSGAGALAIGTRASALAMVQATTLRDALASIGVETRVVTITTDGDVRAPDTAWGEGAFVTAIEAALIEGRIDVAIHSAKDVPTDEDPRLTIAAYLPRGDARDALVVSVRSSAGDPPVMDLVSLPVGSRIGTDSPRRSAFLLARRPDLRVHPIHGNVDTRLRRLDEGATDALILASAGLDRLGFADRISSHLDAAWIPPAPGQGALAVQVRTDDTFRDLVSRLDHAPTRRAVELERAILAQAGGGCRAPLGVLVEADGEGLAVTAGYARPGGGLAVMATRRVSAGPVDGLAESIVDELVGRATLLAQAGGAPRVLVTRAADRWAPTALALVDRGLAPLLVPCIEVESTPNDELDAAVGALDRPDPVEWVVLTSVNAVRAIVATASRLGVDLTPHPLGPRWAAIGRATAAATREAGIAVDLQPAQADGRALAASLPIQPGTRVLLPRGDLADDSLPSALIDRGAAVTEVVAYRTTEAPPASIPLLRAALAEAPAAIVATSGSTVRGLIALGAAIGAEDRLRGIPLVTIGSSTAAEADRLGFDVAREAASPDPAGIADAVAQFLLAPATVR